jgi:quercetin dioxygenase-like cupin family protein
VAIEMGVEATRKGVEALLHDLKVKARIGGELALVQVEDSADTIFQQITVQPGGFTGWHSHPGPAFVTVAQGTFTYYEGDDESSRGG